MQHFAISVIIPAHNEEKTLIACLTALKHQDFSEPYEIIVVDNASTDYTATIAQQAHVKLIYQPVKGVAIARHTGFLAAQAPIIASTDADCIVPPNWLFQISKAFQTYPDHIAIGGYALFYDAPFVVNSVTRVTQRLNLMRVARLISGKQPLSTQNMAIRRDAYHQIGGFNLSITSPLGLDDVDLSLRLSELGPITVLPDLCVWASARRYRKAPLQTISIRLANYVSYAVLHRGVFQHLNSNIRL